MACPVVHFEIGCKDQTKTVDFYKQLFGWQFQAYGTSSMVNTGSTAGIQGHISALGHEPHNYVTVYVQVENLAASLQRAQELGGKTCVPPTDVPGMGQFAWFTDPEGTIVGLWKPVG